jgi:heme exporter protein A
MRLVVEGLTVSRGGRSVLSDLSFVLSAGDALLLTGPNGSGKTTLLRTIAGFLRPDAGRIALEELPGDTEPADEMHFIGHLNGVKASLTVAENLRFWMRYLGGSGGGLERLGLEALAHIPAGYLSAGQKRRLGLARLLTAPRPVWLLDEPAVSLDAASLEMLAGLVRQHLADGGIAIAATHVPLGIEARELRLGGGRT